MIGVEGRSGASSRGAGRWRRKEEKGGGTCGERQRKWEEREGRVGEGRRRGRYELRIREKRGRKLRRREEMREQEKKILVSGPIVMPSTYRQEPLLHLSDVDAGFYHIYHILTTNVFQVGISHAVQDLPTGMSTNTKSMIWNKKLLRIPPSIASITVYAWVVIGNVRHCLPNN